MMAMASDRPRPKWRFVLWLPVGLLFGTLGAKFGRLAKAGELGPIGASELIASAVGIVLVFLAILGSVTVVNAHRGGHFMSAEQVEDLRERSRLFLYSYTWMAAWGLVLILLSLAAPGGLLSAKAAFASVAILIVILSVLGIATWRGSDELIRTLSYETGNMAFYLIVVLGGGWAILAHLGFVVAPAPLDWLTMFTVLMFAASFIAAGRRKLLSR